MPLDKITVKDIVDDCDISRNTFYYNYQDIYAVIEELFESELSALIEQERENCSWMQIPDDICGFLYKYKSAVYSIYNSSRRDVLENQLHRLVLGCVSEAVKNEACGLDVSAGDAEIIARFYTYAVEGFVYSWIENRMNEQIEDLTSSMSRIFNSSMRRALEQAAERFSTN